MDSPRVNETPPLGRDHALFARKPVPPAFAKSRLGGLCNQLGSRAVLPPVD